MLLQVGAAITNWAKFHYKLGQVLQIRVIITSWDITVYQIYLLHIFHYQEIIFACLDLILFHTFLQVNYARQIHNNA